MHIYLFKYAHYSYIYSYHDNNRIYSGKFLSLPIFESSQAFLKIFFEINNVIVHACAFSECFVYRSISIKCFSQTLMPSSTIAAR